MPRIPYFDPATASATEQLHIRSRGTLNLYRMLPYAGLTAPAYLSMGGAILRSGKLDPQLREMAILRVGVLTGASYEVHHHRRLAELEGVAADKVAAICTGVDIPAFTATERLVLRFADELVHKVKAPDDLFEPVLAALGRQQIAELVLTVGFYLMVSRFLENFEIEIETALP